MEFVFSKYAGCGNDFILYNDLEETFLLDNNKLIQRLCHRSLGIGADGVILLQNSSKADFRMRIFNPDGSEAEMCGNGIRCLMKFIQEIGFNLPSCRIESKHRVHRVGIENESISVEMGEPSGIEWDMEVDLPNEKAIIHQINTGVPHVIEFFDDIEKVNLKKRGPLFRNHALFSPHGVNYNTAQLIAENTIAIRTFERGVEAETLACGTGATAAALAVAKKKSLKSPIKVQTQSGETLKIYFETDKGQPKQIWLAGPANKIYTGKASFDTFLT